MSEPMSLQIDQKCILCIEPVGEICLLLGMMLHRNDLRMRHVAKMEEAAAFLEHKQPGLIIIENTFAENSMLTSIAVIKERAPTSKILLVSSIGDEVAKKAVAAGVDVFLTKPFGKSALVKAALSMLGAGISE